MKHRITLVRSKSAAAPRHETSSRDSRHPRREAEQTPSPAFDTFENCIQAPPPPASGSFWRRGARRGDVSRTRHPTGTLAFSLALGAAFLDGAPTRWPGSSKPSNERRSILLALFCCLPDRRPEGAFVSVVRQPHSSSLESRHLMVHVESIAWSPLRQRALSTPPPRNSASPIAAARP